LSHARTSANPSLRFASALARAMVGHVADLIEILHSTPTLDVRVVWGIGALAERASPHLRALATPRAIQPLLRALPSTSADVQFQIAYTLAQLCSNSADARAIVGGEVDALRAVLYARDDDAHCHALLVICCLTNDPAQLLDADPHAPGGVWRAVALLGAASVDTKRRAAACVAYIAVHHLALHKRLLDFGAVDALIPLLAAQNLWLRQCAICAVGQLSRLNAAAARRCVRGGVVPQLVSSLTSYHWRINENTVHALYHIAQAEPSVRPSLVDAGVVDTLIGTPPL
jgi:hypothetical protein